MTRRTASHHERGFTLVELMMALVIFSVAVAGILSVAVSMTQGFREQRLAVHAQDAVRAPIDMIADALRQASPGVSVAANVHDAVICSSGAIVPYIGTTPQWANSTTASDTLDVIYATGGVVTGITAASIPVSLAGGNVTVAHANSFSAGDYALFTSDFGTGHVMKVTSATGNNLVLTAGGSCGSATIWTYSYGAGATVIRVQHARFSVSNDASNNNMPTLWMDPDSAGSAAAEPLAEGIEDMQIAYGVDSASDGIDLQGTTAHSATDEWRYNHASDTAVDATTVVRAIRLTLIARTTSGEHGNQNTYAKPVSEDRTAASTADQYRRRVLKTVVEIRNVAGSP